MNFQNEMCGRVGRDPLQRFEHNRSPAIPGNGETNIDASMPHTASNGFIAMGAFLAST
jgi:hypothetical protein